MIGCTNHEAVKILRNTGTVVILTFERYLRGPKYEQLQQAIKANELRPPSPPSPSVSSLPKIPFSLIVSGPSPTDYYFHHTIISQQMESLTVEPDPESRTSIDFDSTIFQEEVEEEKEIVIDNRKTVKFNLFDQESVREKWKAMLSGAAEIIVRQRWRSCKQVFKWTLT